MGYIYNGVKVLTLAEFKGGEGGQNFQEIKASLKPGKPWSDPEFSSHSTSVGSPVDSPHFVWRRAKDITPNPVFFDDSANEGSETSRFDIIQGMLADCWFMVAIDALVEKPALAKMVIPEDNTFENDNTVFHFRFWRYGVWVDVVVDDWLPTYQTIIDKKVVTKTAFAGNRGNEFWIPLLEKAYAKFNGSYAMLNLGVCGDALEDLTGGLSFDIMIRSPTAPSPEHIYGHTADAYERGSLICLGILSQLGDKAGETKQANGLARGHAYCVTGMGQVPYQSKKVALVRIRNPWGSDFEWNGAWSDGSKEWDSFDKKKVESLGLKKGDGEFWMSWDDMLTNFDILSICHLAGDVVKLTAAPGAVIQHWRPFEFHGSWAGAGCANNEEIAKNPQYILDIRKSNMKETTLVIAVMNHAIGLTGKDKIPDVYFPILYRVKDPKESKITEAFAAAELETALELQTPPTPCGDRESFNHYLLPKGVYVIIPIFGRWVGVVGKFLLRMYTNSDAEVKELLPRPTGNN